MNGVIKLSELYDKIKASMKFLFILTFVVTLSACANDYMSWPGADTGVVTRNPDVMPDIRWQTPDQRKILSEKLEKAQNEANQARLKAEIEKQGKLISSSDISWKEDGYLGNDRLKEEDPLYQTDPIYEDLYPENDNKYKDAIESRKLQLSETQKVKVHLLVPLSGDKANLGSSMLNAAQMALFDVGSQNFELIPIDTKGNKFDARLAAERAVKEESDLVLGPVFSTNLKEVKPILKKANIPTISFTNNWELADDNTYIMGFMPFTQASRVTKYAVRKGYKNFAAYAPKTKYCDVVVKTMKNALKTTPATIADVGRYASQQRDVSNLVADFIETHKVILTPENMEDISIDDVFKIDEETGELIEQPISIDAYKVEEITSEVIKEKDTNKDKTDEEKEEEEFTLDFDALMLPLGGEGLRSIINQLEINNVDQNKIKYIGTGLWDDFKLNNFPSMYGAWFAAPDPRMREDFKARFNENFGAYPVRIASLAYDATALAAVLARSARSEASPYTRENLTNQRGFAGIDGIFRFREDGLSERGLAILEIRPGEMRVIDRAPTAFLPRGY